MRGGLLRLAIWCVLGVSHTLAATLELQGASSSIQLNKAVLSASCADNKPYTLVVEQGDPTEVKMHFRNVPETCAYSRLEEPCHATNGEAYYPSLWWCVYTGSGDSVYLGPLRTNVSSVTRALDDALLATTVYLACPVPSQAIIVRTTGYIPDATPVAINISAAYGEGGSQELLPYGGIGKGNELWLDGWHAPPPESPPPPPAAPPPPQSPPQLLDMLPNAACKPASDPANPDAFTILQFEDDRSIRDAPNDPAIIQSGVTNQNFFFIGVGELESRNVRNAEVCLGSTGDCSMECYPLAAEYYATSAGGQLTSLDSYYPLIAGLSTKLKKMAGCFAGLCPCRDGSTCAGASNHWFYDCQSKPCGIAAGSSSAWYYDDRSYIQIGPHTDHPALWSRARTAWHIWGGGVSAAFGNDGGEIGRYGDNEDTGTNRNLFWILANTA